MALLKSTMPATSGSDLGVDVKFWAGGGQHVLVVSDEGLVVRKQLRIVTATP